MTSGENKRHQKHAKLKRPKLGQFGRNEIAILGTPCGNVKQLVRYLVDELDHLGPIAFVDADHKAAEPEESQALSFTDKISFRRFDYLDQFNTYQIRPYFNVSELVLVNGNHFKATVQIVVIDPKKSLDRKLDRLTNPVLVVKKDPKVSIPEYLKSYVEGLPVMHWDQQRDIADFIKNWLSGRRSEIKGLVLAGGWSIRMKQDKGALDYHGTPQRQYVHKQLQQLGVDAFISCRQEQIDQMEEGLPLLPDTFQGLGPMGALLTAFREDPECGWLAIACDLPYLTLDSLRYLVDNRDASKVATAFQSPFDDFPEPLITIWEPKSYPVILNFLSQGYSCPRKVLINSDVRILEAPHPKELSNVNHPEEYREAVKQLTIKN